MNNKEIRWRQRFENYERAVQELQKACLVPEPSKLEKAGVIQFFEMCMELAWKTLKDYFEDKGKVIHAPKDIIKQAFQDEIISDGTLWLKALEDRNLSSHLYDEKVADRLDRDIRKLYLPQLQSLYERLRKET